MCRSSISLTVLLALVNSVCAQMIPVNSPDKGTSTTGVKMHSVQYDSYSFTSHVAASEPVRLSLGGMALTADSGLLIHDADFIIASLRDNQDAPLQSDMINLTGGAKAYRLLPHGEHFSSPALLEVAYEPASLPYGFRPEEIYTYYYNEQLSQWLPLERVSIDTLRHIVVSRTTHFTDFVNAVIRTPDMPEVSAFVPTQISDIETPNPLQHLTLMAAPQINSYGSANMTYPIEIPVGRNGLQPDVSLMYNSMNGNGLLGYGWSIPQSAVTIDTRWGVPRYDQTYESDIYTIDGMQCVLKDGNPDLKLPYQTNVRIVRQEGEVRFIARDTKNCNKIIRHGNSPKNYWWEVTDRVGTIYYYGKYASDTSVNPHCVLKDAEGNIGYWALAEVVDMSGNYIMYEYAVSPSHEIYPKFIYYTGHRSSDNTVDLEPSYRVFFHYDERADIVRDGRLGFVRQTDSIMCYIDLTFLPNSSGDGSICLYQNRRFLLSYDNSTSVSLLTQIQDYFNYFDVRWPINGDCTLPTQNCRNILNGITSFDYYDSPLADIFSAEEVVLPKPESIYAALSKSESSNWNAGGTATVGLGVKVWNTNLSVGGNYRYSESEGSTSQMLMDMNGDGLSDLVYIQNNTICFRPQYYENNTPQWGNPVSTGIFAKELSHDHSSTHSWGLQAGVESYGVTANVSGGKSYTNSFTNNFFSDVNGDGLPDYINEGQVYFNRSQAHNDFVAHSDETEVILDSTQCVYFYYDGEVEFIPDCYERDTIVASYVFQTSDCSLNYHGTDPKPIPVHPWDTLVHCEECDSLIIEYLQTGDCPIDLHINRAVSDYSQSDSKSAIVSDSVQRGTRFPIDQVYDCLKYCGAELPCKECWEYYLSGRWDLYEQCKEENGCRTLCAPCVYHLLENDEQGYLNCMNDTCLEGTLYTVSTPCYDCESECLQDVNQCRECIESNPRCMVCEECTLECMNSLEDCMACKMLHNCKGYHFDKCLETVCNGTNINSRPCAECILEYGYYCEECYDTCLLYPELCGRCINHHCYYDETYTYHQECYWQALRALNQWKTNIRQQYNNITFVQEGDTYYAHKIDTICPPNTNPDIEAVRVWVAPQSGYVNLHSSIQLIEDTGYNRRQARQVDGVHYIIQHHQHVSANHTTHTLNSTSNNIIANETIGANDYNPKTNTYTHIHVSAGDVFFFHLRSNRTHNFDNVNWSQTITYDPNGPSYSSVNDFICSSDNIFQAEHSGAIVLNTDINCTGASTAVLTILVNNQPVDSVNINSSTIHSHKEFAYPEGGSVSLQLSSQDNLGNIEVRPYLSYTPSLVDSVNQPYSLWLAPKVLFTREIELDSLYYHLFGPLYKGWGQFAYNNTISTDNIPIQSLSNTAIEYARTSPSDSASFCQAITFSPNDTLSLIETGDIEGFFSTRNMYDPLDNAWIQMSPEMSQYRWEAYGLMARNGRYLLSNTRDTKAMLSALAGDTMIVGEVVEYDSEVPVLPAGRRVMAVRKESQSTQWNVNAGFGVLTYGAGHTHSESDYEVTSDYMDMNGDNYPDIVRTSTIQYTQPWGGLGANKEVNISSYSNHSVSTGNSISGSYSTAEKIQSGNLKDGKYFSRASGSLGASEATTISRAAIAYIDVNADGLPDKLIRNDNGSISACLNIGYGFASPFILLSNTMIDSNQSVCTGGNLGVGGDIGWGDIAETVRNILGTDKNTLTSKYQLSISFGADINWSTNKLVHRLMDINGDGVLDIVKQANNDQLEIYLMVAPNTAAASISNQIMQQSTTLSWGINMGITFGFPVFWVKVCLGLNGSPQGGSITLVQKDLVDMNGDGLADLVWIDNDYIHIRYNQSGKNRLLKTVTNPTGQKFRLDYELSAPTYERRGRQWLLSEVRDMDPFAHPILGCDTIMRTFAYSDPHYDYGERQFLGYGATMVYDINTDTLPHTNYRKTVRRYNNQDYIEHGKLIYEGLMDADDNLFREYEIGTWYVDSTYTPTNNLCGDASLRVGTEVHYTRYYEGGEEPVVAAKKYEYDKYHNVLEYTNFGDTVLTDDELRASIVYDSTNIDSYNLISLPSRMVVYSNGMVVREAQADYLDGKLTELRRSDPVFSLTDTTNYHYDSFGMPDSLIYPGNQSGQRAYIAVSYDQYSHTKPAVVTDQWNRSVQTTYDKYWKVPLSQIDPSGFSIVYKYDSIGRPYRISAPGDTTLHVYYNPLTQDTTYNTENNITIEYRYSPRSNLRYSDEAPYTKTFISLQNIQDETYFSRRGNMVYNKEKILRNSINGYEFLNEWRFSDLVALDCFGRIKARYKNYIDSNDSAEFVSIDSLRLLSQHSYDILDRPTAVQWQDGAVQTNTYSLGNDAFGKKRLMQIFTDERGCSVRKYTAPQGWITTSVLPGNTKTAFVYDPLGQLLQSTDPDGLSTTYIYDGWGRKRQRNHPDAGVSQWRYDNAGNLISSATQTQINSGTSTNYEYDYNRLSMIHYPQHPQLDVAYEYDSIGRVSKRTDITGCESFLYDALGNVSVSDRLIVLPSDTVAYKFQTQFEYDPLGRTKYIIYPDNEEVQYIYYKRNLAYVNGTDRHDNYHCYIHNIEYDANKSQTRYESGNRYITDYIYNSDRLWLSSFRTYNNQHLLQDMQYTYDNVGNITSIEQNADSVHWLGGAYMQEYRYDSLYRLTKADMISDYFGEYSDYTMTYSPSGMVGIKSCDDMLWNYWHGYCSVNNSITNHQVRSIYDMENDATTFLMWDAAGRLQDIYRPCTGNLRHHWWNESGQMAAVVDNGHCAFYGYDGNGERAYKLTGTTSIDQYNAGQETFHMHLDDAVMYVNPYFVVTPKGYTKHYYNGTQRIATQIGVLDDLPDDIIDTSAVARERINNVQSYMQSLFSQSITLEPDTTSTFVDIDGDAYDELQWQCTDDSLVWHIAIQCDSNILLPVLSKDSSQLDNRVSGIYFYHPDHLGSATWITHGSSAVQFIHYMPFGEMWYNQQGSAYNERFKFTGKERDAETGYDYFGARYYSADMPLWLSVDPLADKYPWISPYAYCSWNPINRVDFDGMDDEQREAAINKANQYVKMNPGKSYEWGAKGDPGQKVDCSGLVSKCAIAGGEKDPNKGQYNGVRNIANNTQKIDDMNEIEAGNFVIFNTGGKNGDYSHIGIITDVTHDDDGNVVDFQFIHSGNSTGPTRTGANSRYSRNSPLYWKDIVTGFYKWDTRPDTHSDPILPQITALGDKPSWMNPICPFSIGPITININPCIRR